MPGSVIGVPDPLCLLTVHAHPDDESSKGAGTVARYHAEGVHTVLVCCTGGEEGEILNPALDTPEVHARLPGSASPGAGTGGRASSATTRWSCWGTAIRAWPDSEANANPLSFARAAHDEAVGGWWRWSAGPDPRSW